MNIEEIAVPGGGVKPPKDSFFTKTESLSAAGIEKKGLHSLRHQYVKPTTKTFLENNMVLDAKSRTQLNAQGRHNMGSGTHRSA